MPKTKKRTNAKNLSKTAKNLTPAQAKKVKGGYSGGVNVVLGDGSVRFADGSIKFADGSIKFADGSIKSLKQ
jgi:prepilin-type processing-associated H-X9-DG protein